MGADVVRGLRRTPHPAQHKGVLHQLHREPHHTGNWQRPSGQADYHPDPAVLQQSPENRTSSTQKLPTTERCQPQPQSGAGRSYTAAQLPGAGGGGAADPCQPRSGLQAATARKTGNENSAAGENRPVSCRSGKTRIAGRFLSGTDHRPAERGVIGPPMDGLRCREQNAFHHETGEPHQRGISGKPSENEKFYSHIGPSAASGRPADCRAQKAPSQPISVPIAQDRNHV